MSDHNQIIGDLPVAEPVATNGTPTKTVGYLSIEPGTNEELPDEITSHLIEIQKAFPALPLWVVMHNGDEKKSLCGIYPDLWKSFYESKDAFKQDEPILLLIVSPGGDAESAYRIAKFLRGQCKEFTVIIPDEAKSAATLLALGAKEIFIGRDADLGPLDAQISEYNEEREYSGLDEIQSIESLFELANDQIINTTMFWSKAFHKKKSNLFPHVIDFVTGMMKPLMDKIDTVHYVTLTRMLKIAEEYAYRLLVEEYGHVKAKLMARDFVNEYPYHGFIIDKQEAEKIGLRNIKELSPVLQSHCDAIMRLTHYCRRYLIGKFTTKN